VYDIALEAMRRASSISAWRAVAKPESVIYATVIAERRLLPPLDHADAVCDGTGLSTWAAPRCGAMRQAADRGAAHRLDEDVQVGPRRRQAAAGIGVQPEWFYKGDGRCVVAPEQALELPAYALDGGEEVEVVGLYLIGDSGEVYRVGFALGNEYSDHVMERQNYLYLAHSKLRQCAYGPELLLGELPPSVAGSARLTRDGKAIWSDTWVSGNDNMAHAIANLEHHHFKYRDFRRPGDVHVHFFGAATGSFTKNVKAQPGDVFELECRSSAGRCQPSARRAVALQFVRVRTL
jgi:hypothetical protein